MNNDTSLSDEIITIDGIIAIGSSNEYCGNIEELLKSENTQKVITILENHWWKIIEWDFELQNKENIITNIYTKIIKNIPITSNEQNLLIEFFKDEKIKELWNRIIWKLWIIKSSDNNELFKNYIEDENWKFKVDEIFKAILEKISKYKLVTKQELKYISWPMICSTKSSKIYEYIKNDWNFWFFEVSNWELSEVEETKEDIENYLSISFTKENFVHFLTKKDDKFLFSTKKYISKKEDRKTYTFVFSDKSIKIYIEKEEDNYHCLKNTEAFINENSIIRNSFYNDILIVENNKKYYYYKISNDYNLEEIEELQWLDICIDKKYLKDTSNSFLFEILTSFTKIWEVESIIFNIWDKKTWETKISASIYKKWNEAYIVNENTLEIFKLKKWYILDENNNILEERTNLLKKVFKYKSTWKKIGYKINAKYFVDELNIFFEEVKTMKLV